MIKALPHKDDPLLRLNAVCPYFTMFPLQFPFERLAKAEPGQVVLDPFCGRGTTLYAARLRGLKAIGIDSNPVAAAIARAKLASAKVEDVIGLCKEILEDSPHPKQIPKGEFWSRCFHQDTLLDVCKLREYFIQQCRSDAELLLRAIVLGILHGPRLKTGISYLSNQMPRTYSTKPVSAVNYWKKHRLRAPLVDTLVVIQKKAERCLTKVPRRTSGKVVCADSRQLKALMAKADWVITSPPYYGLRTYLPDQWLRSWFLGGPPEVVYGAFDQIKHCGRDVFTKDLALVWNAVARQCNAGAHLIMRFGALPSCEADPSELARESFYQSDAPWRILTARNAGVASKGRRQADQFRAAGNPVDEIDVYARLEA